MLFYDLPWPEAEFIFMVFVESDAVSESLSENQTGMRHYLFPAVIPEELTGDLKNCRRSEAS